jgi:hypothetical protein
VPAHRENGVIALIPRCGPARASGVRRMAAAEMEEETSILRENLYKSERPLLMVASVIPPYERPCRATMWADP